MESVSPKQKSESVQDDDLMLPKQQSDFKARLSEMASNANFYDNQDPQFDFEEEQEQFELEGRQDRFSSLSKKEFMS